MLAVYILALVVGGALVVLSLMGGADHSHDSDAHGDVGGHDHDAGGHDGVHEGSGHSDSHANDTHAEGPWLPFLSLRFWIYLAAGFGLSGVLLSLLTGIGEPQIALWSLVVGGILGTGIAYAVRVVSQSEADSSTRAADLLGKEAKVTIPIRDMGPGRVRVSVKGEWIDYLARLEQPGNLDAGEDVVIVAVEDDVVKVMPRSAIFN